MSVTLAAHHTEHNFCLVISFFILWLLIWGEVRHILSKSRLCFRAECFRRFYVFRTLNNKAQSTWIKIDHKAFSFTVLLMCARKKQAVKRNMAALKPFCRLPSACPLNLQAYNLLCFQKNLVNVPICLLNIEN